MNMDKIRYIANQRIVIFITIMMVLIGCSHEKSDSIFMDGIPQSGFTIDYACFLNQDSAIIIGRHKEYIDSVTNQYCNSVEVYVSNDRGVKWSLKSKFTFNELMHSGNTIKTNTEIFTSIFSQTGDAYLLNTKYYPGYSAKLISTGEARYLPIAVKNNLLYSTTNTENGFALLTLDSTFHILTHLPSPHLSQTVFWKDELYAIRRHAINNNMFVYDKNGQWHSHTCPVNPSFIAGLKDDICIAGSIQSDAVELYSFTHFAQNPKLLYSTNDYTFVKDLVTDRLNTMALVLGYKTGLFMKYKLIVSNNSGKDWKTLDIPNSELYAACSIYGNSIYLFLSNNRLIQYRIS